MAIDVILFVGLVLLSLGYIVFDLFNGRRVPLWFIVAGLIFALVFSVSLLYGVLFALVNCTMGLVFKIYKFDIGLADVLEIATYSLALPLVHIGWHLIPSFVFYWVIAVGVGLLFKFTIYKGKEGMPFTIAIIFGLLITPIAVGLT